MGRSIPHNSHTSPELLAQVNPHNQQLLKDFIEYMDSIGKSDTTLIGYRQDLNIAFCWNLRFNGNKEYQLWTKHDIQRYQSYMVVECHVSPARMRRLKAVLSSLSNFIEDMLDEDYPEFRNTVNRIKSPPKGEVLEKQIICIFFNNNLPFGVGYFLYHFSLYILFRIYYYNSINRKDVFHERIYSSFYTVPFNYVLSGLDYFINVWN